MKKSLVESKLKQTNTDRRRNKQKKKQFLAILYSIMIAEVSVGAGSRGSVAATSSANTVVHVVRQQMALVVRRRRGHSSPFSHRNNSRLSTCINKMFYDCLRYEVLTGTGRSRPALAPPARHLETIHHTITDCD